MTNVPDKRLQPTASRRDFLFGKVAIDSLKETLAALIDPGLAQNRNGELPSANFDALSRPSAYWEQYSIRAMACEFELLFHLQQHPHAASVATEAFQLVESLEDQMTVYRPHSEISRINALAGQQAIEVEAHLFGLLETALELYRETEGAFDITAAGLTQLWKFDQRAGSLPGAAAIAQTLKNVGSNQIEIDPGNRTIRFTNPELQINLGGIGKGYAIDRAANLILRTGIKDFAIHGGQSSVKAFGNDFVDPVVAPAKPESKPESNPELKSEQGWWIGLSHPVVPSVRLGKVCLINQSLGTSGTGRQGFFHRGVRYGHIIDPRTGWPTSHFLSTTVITDSAARSDALATAFYVMPLEQVVDYCDRHPDVKAILVSNPADNQRPATQPGIHSELLVQTFNIADQDLQFEQ